MIPLQLRLRGLHSFREEQALDFDQVLGHGIFGIFGPTGSGKSTVLDAITLALYGRVERASGTQGICNQAEDRLEVDFSFGLEGPEGARRYRAQRSYARQAPDGLRTAKCRLSEIHADGAVEVLAERERDMTRLVRELMGLTVEDFTRAVVLPQGRFAEFLHLGGAERRRMLQRLFNLERYGDALSARVKARFEAAEREQGEVRAEQLGLGDASAEALAEAEARHGSAQVASTAAAERLKGAQAERESAALVWGMQAELAQVAQAESRLGADELEARRREAELRAAERAEAVRAFLDGAAEAREALTAARAHAAEAAEASDGAGEAAATARRARDEARRRRAERQGPLQERRLRLSEAVHVQTDLQALEIRRAEAAASLGSAEDRCKDALERSERAESERLASRRRSQDASIALGRAQVDPEERAQVDGAVQALVAHRRAVAARAQAAHALAEAEAASAAEAAGASAAGEERAVAQQAYTEAERSRRGLGEAPRRDDAPEWTQTLRGTSRAIEQVRHQEEEAMRSAQAAAAARMAVEAAAAARQSAAMALSGAERRLAEAQEALRAAQSRGVAGTLAAELREGQPCPVCGSVHHPSPATEAPADLAAAEARVAASDRHRRDAQGAFQEAAAAEAAAGATLTAEERSAAKLERDLRQARAELDEMKARLPEPVRTLDPAGLGAYLREETAALVRAEADQREWESAVAEADRQRQEALRLFLAAQDAATERQSLAAAARGTRAAAWAAAAEAERAAVEAAGVLEGARGQRSDEQIAAAREELSRRDRVARVVLEQLGPLSAAAEAAEQAAEQARATVEAARGEVRDHQGALRDLTAAAGRLQAELERATRGGAPADRQLAEVDDELQALGTAEAESLSAAEAAESALGAARAAAAAAEAERGAAERRAEAAGGQLHEALTDAGFGDEAEARAAFRDAAALGLLRGRVEAHTRERQRLAAERARLEALLAGRSLASEAWDAVRRRLDHAEAEARTAQEDLGVAREAADRMRDRHGRWQALQTRREELDAALAALSALQGVLRGGAFVEFVAEEQLRGVALDASARLGELTRFRYALEVDAQGGFCIRDDWNGGTRRPATTLSGGETFLASLALALALSAQIQLRGRYPLQFFFLDEGFGTLDPEALDTAMQALERLQAERVHIGVISHVPEVRTRLARRVVVEPAEPGGRGSRLYVEVA